MECSFKMILFLKETGGRKIIVQNEMKTEMIFEDFFYILNLRKQLITNGKRNKEWRPKHFYFDRLAIYVSNNSKTDRDQNHHKCDVNHNFLLFRIKIKWDSNWIDSFPLFLIFFCFPNANNIY